MLATNLKYTAIKTISCIVVLGSLCSAITAQTRSSFWLGSAHLQSFQLGQLNANLGQLNANLTYPYGTTFIVTNTNDDGPGSLRQAIRDANLNAGHDTVSLAMIAGQTVRQGHTITVNLKSELLVTDSLTILGPGAGLLSIQGDKASPGNRIFNIRSPGGRIRFNLVGVTVTLGKLLESLGRDGSSIVKDEEDSSQGKLLESLGRGGAIYASNAIVSIHQSAIVGNSAAVGGGIYQESGILNISETAVEGNDATDTGGGVAIGPAAEAYITTSLLSENTSLSEGSAISGWGELVLINSTVTNNRSEPTGSAICWFPSETSLTVEDRVFLINSTISHNNGLGFKNLGISAVALGNTVVAQNRSASGHDFEGRARSNGTNVISSMYCEDCMFFSADIGDVIGTPDEPIDVRLGPLQDNGGATRTRALFGDSPALDRGNNCVGTAFFDGGCMPFAVTADQRLGAGFSRIMNGRVDIGAYENNYIDPPTDAGQCKDGDWQLFYNPRVFSNQGDCVRFVLTGR